MYLKKKKLPPDYSIKSQRNVVFAKKKKIKNNENFE